MAIRNLTRFSCLLFTLAATQACGDDTRARDAAVDVGAIDVRTAQDVGAPEDSAAPEDVGTADDGQSVQDSNFDVGDVPFVPNACANAADMTAIERTFSVDGEALTLDETALRQGRQCFLDGQRGQRFLDCARDGINADTAGALTRSCLGCYASFMFCAVDPCFPSICGAKGPACDRCLCEGGPASCVRSFEICSGLSRDTCE